MSVLIKGMDMPDNCEECKIKLWDEGENDYVCPFSGVMTLSIGRQNDCPLEEQEPCEDCVSRQAAIDAALSAFSRGLLASPDIRKLPSVQPEPQWIPCSEMEPKKSGHYLCTHSGTGIVSPDYYTTQEQAEELFADPEDEYLDLEEYIGWTSKNVIAWMPLPEPYRAERRTDGN